MIGKQGWLKVAGFWAGFMVLHYAYDFLPILPFQLLSGVDESVFQHMKICFYAYLLVSAIEYAIRRKKLDISVESFTFSRLLAAILVPWFMFILWYMAPAYYGHLPSVFVEVLYANIIMVLLGFCTVALEQGFEAIRYTPTLKGVIIALALISISLYTIFTFRLPWTDVFADPYG